MNSNKPTESKTDTKKLTTLDEIEDILSPIKNRPIDREIPRFKSPDCDDFTPEEAQALFDAVMKDAPPSHIEVMKKIHECAARATKLASDTNDGGKS